MVHNGDTDEDSDFDTSSESNAGSSEEEPNSNEQGDIDRADSPLESSESGSESNASSESDVNRCAGCALVRHSNCVFLVAMAAGPAAAAAEVARQV
jgi:hypothetical protein